MADDAHRLTSMTVADVRRLPEARGMSDSELKKLVDDTEVLSQALIARVRDLANRLLPFRDARLDREHDDLTAALLAFRTRDLEVNALVAKAEARVAEEELRSAKLELSLAERDSEVDTLKAHLRQVDREASEKRIEARIAEAREAERVAVATENRDLRVRLDALGSEVAELRRAKKRLREALDRLAGKD